MSVGEDKLVLSGGSPAKISRLIEVLKLAVDNNLSDLSYDELEVALAFMTIVTYLTSANEVHHIDEDVNNCDLSNLIATHVSGHALPCPFPCPHIQNLFESVEKKVSDNIRDQIDKIFKDRG